MALTSEQDTVVSPYAIRNLTEVEIVIEKQLTDDEIQRKEMHDKKRREARIHQSTPIVENKPLSAIIEEGSEM